MPFGAELEPEGGVRFRIWAPAAEQVDLLLEGPAPPARQPMQPVGHGFFEARLADAGAGQLYRFALADGRCFPDPASRFQPRDVHGPSEVIDAAAFPWRDAGWQGRRWEEVVLYELHVGAFTSAGSHAGVAARLDHLADLGVTALELMPLAECPGGRNWGYDGVYPFAPEARYGRPEALKALIDAAHGRGLMVFLDVVYNHFGPEGNHLHAHAPDFFTERHQTPWGPAIDFEGPRSRAVRDFFVHNALYWIEEYHIDGLRLDAVHAIHDATSPDVLAELARAVRAATPTGRHVHLVLENDRNEASRLARDEAGSPRSFVAQWNDDAHHAFHVLLTRESAGYYEDYAHDPIGLLGRCLTEGFAYQGEPSKHRGGRPRGESSAGLPLTAFVNFLQNHDQIGNRALGERLTRLASPHALDAASAILLLAPSPPLLFMGEEWGALEPFPFFCDFGADLAALVRDGRRREFAAFPQFRDDAARGRIPDPGAEETFASAVLRWEALERPAHAARLRLHRELLALRQREIVPRLRGLRGGAGRYACLGARALHVRWRLGDGAALSLCCNLGDAAQVAAPASPGGRVLYASQPGLEALVEAGTLPPWSVFWRLDAAPAPGAG